jgi:hypothetical protein
MGYSDNPLIIDKKYEDAMEEVDDSLEHPKAKMAKSVSAVNMHGSPLNKFLGMDGKQWANVGVGVAGAAATALGGPLAGAAVNQVGGALVDANMEGDAEKEARIATENAEASAAEQAKLDANNTTSGNNISAGGYGQQVQGADPSQSVFANGSLDPSKYTDLTGNTAGSTAVAKKLGEVKPYYENQKMSAAQYNRSAAMMTISGVSSLEKKGCYKPK